MDGAHDEDVQDDVDQRANDRDHRQNQIPNSDDTKSKKADAVNGGIEKSRNANKERNSPADDMAQNLENEPKTSGRLGANTPACAGECQRECKRHRPQICCRVACILCKPEKLPNCLENPGRYRIPLSEIDNPVHDRGEHAKEREENVRYAEIDEETICNEGSWPLFDGSDDNRNDHESAAKKREGTDQEESEIRDLHGELPIGAILFNGHP